MTALPTLYVSHGAPTLALDPGNTGPALTALGRELPRPAAILMVSAHWETPRPAASTASQPETIHDFGGFPDELYRMTYPAPGAPDVARRAKDLLDAAGIGADLDPRRGLDHGAWVPLRFLYPAADVPVTQLSIQPRLGPAHHYRVGEALRALTEAGVLIIASGSLTHNLYELRMTASKPGPEPYALEFQEWVYQAINANDIAMLLDYRRLAPQAVRAHPTDEHFLPLFVALGAAGGSVPVRRVNREITFGALAMDAYLFGSSARTGDTSLAQQSQVA
ncbi:MAG TPA: class III extradiol ring-cleavage dioxygenase [Burkholderiales bacterium]|nr:class III extradiol ring-cleavage dioxygenase [Burkholderiales bacterium]